MIKRRVCVFGMAAVALTFLTSSVSIAADNFKIVYFDSANTTGGAWDAQVRVSNPGYSAGPVYSAIYVFDSAEEMVECCACSQSVNGLRTLSVNNDLTANPVTGVSPTEGPIYLVSTNQPDPGAVEDTNLVTGGIRVWATNLYFPPGGIDITVVLESEAQDAPLTAADEIGSLAKQCNRIEIVGSGHGICGCGTGE